MEDTSKEKLNNLKSEEKPPKRKLTNDENNEECERVLLAKVSRSESSGCHEELGISSYTTKSDGEELIKNQNVLCVSGSKDLCAEQVDCVAHTDSGIVVLSKEEIIRQAWKKRSKEKKKRWKARKRLAAEQAHLLKTDDVGCEIKFDYSGNGSKEIEKDLNDTGKSEANEGWSREVDNKCGEETRLIINEDVCSIETETAELKNISKNDKIVPVIINDEVDSENDKESSVIKEVQITPVINVGANENNMDKITIKEVQKMSEECFETENEFNKMIKDCDNEIKISRSSKVENNTEKSGVDHCNTELLDYLVNLELNQESFAVESETSTVKSDVESETSAVESEISAVESKTPAVESETSAVESKVSIDNNQNNKVGLEDFSSKQSQTAPLSNRNILSEKVDRDLQVVIMPKDDSSLTRDRFTLILEEFMDSMLKELLDFDKENTTAPVLQFHKTGLVEEGWCLISCLTEETKDWTLNWKPKDSDLIVLPEVEVKWPIKIRILVKSLTAVNIMRLTQRLRTQNRDAKVETWRYLSTRQGKLKFWQVTFAVSLEVANHLFRENLMLAYKTTFLKVSLSYRGRKERTNF